MPPPRPPAAPSKRMLQRNPSRERPLSRSAAGTSPCKPDSGAEPGRQSARVAGGAEWALTAPSDTSSAAASVSPARRCARAEKVIISAVVAPTRGRLSRVVTVLLVADGTTRGGPGTGIGRFGEERPTPLLTPGYRARPGRSPSTSRRNDSMRSTTSAWPVSTSKASSIRRKREMLDISSTRAPGV